MCTRDSCSGSSLKCGTLTLLLLYFAPQLSHPPLSSFTGLHALLQDQDGDVVTGGLDTCDRDDLYIPPTVLSEPSTKARIMHEVSVLHNLFK